MKDFVISAVMIAVGGLGLTHVDAVERFYTAAYPVIPGQEQALDYCAAENREFDRLDPAERDSCYARFRAFAERNQRPGLPQGDVRRREAAQH
jgi:hypothetical protein